MSASIRRIQDGTGTKLVVNEQIANQHTLLEKVLREAGAQPITPLVGAGYTGKIADMIFADDDVIVEVKSLTTDRAADPAVGTAVNEMFARNTHLGAPVVFGTVAIGLHDLPVKVAANALRIIGSRIQTETKAANKQLKASKVVLGRQNALGLVALITPPFKLDQDSISWLVGDVLREGRCSSIDAVLLVETPLAGPEDPAANGNSFLTLHPRGERLLPPHLVEAIYQAWGRVTGQLGRRDSAD